MIEVLISAFVLALGVIGAAGMQLAALRTSQQSAFQTTALELAVEIADKMRANDSQMRRPDNPFLKVNFNSAGGTGSSTSGSLCYSKGANCGAEALAQFDIHEWENRVRASLPGARAVICRDASPWNNGVGALAWACTESPGASLVVKLGWQPKNPDDSLVTDDAKQFPPSVALIVEPYIK